jgi:dolichol kinase
MEKKGAILKDPEDEDVRSMSRTSSPSELLYGPLQMTLIMCHVGLNRYMTPTGIIVMSSLVGDGIAAMIGLEYGKHTYRMPLVGGQKSIEGSLGCMLGTIGGMLLYSYMTGIDISSHAGWDGGGGGGGGTGLSYYYPSTIPTVVVYGVISTIVEATALRNYDNLLLALAMEVTVKHFNAKMMGTTTTG